MGILNYIGSIARNIGKDEIFEDIRITKKEISEKLIPLYSDAAKYFRVNKPKSEQVKSLNISFMNAYRKQDKVVDMFDAVNRALPKILANLDILSEELNKSLETKIITQAVTYRKAMLLKALDLISFASIYSFKLLTYCYYFESKEIENNEYDDLSMPKPYIKMIIANITNYARILKELGCDSNKFYSNISTLKDVILDKDTEAAIDAIKDHDSLHIEELTPLGFDGNPIFHFRLMYAEWQANRYKLNKETKTYLELKLANLKMQNEGHSDPKLQKEIEYTASRINTLEYKIQNAEKSAGLVID